MVYSGGHAQAESISSELNSLEEPAGRDNEGAAQHPQLASSQSRHDPRIAALLSSYTNSTPIILLIGEKYPHIDFNLNCAFAVLGWYWVTACWAEKESNGMVRWKVRFQWVESQGQPWWLPETSVLPPNKAHVEQAYWNPRARVEMPQRHVLKDLKRKTWTTEALGDDCAVESAGRYHQQLLECQAQARQRLLQRDLAR